jgi:hypothetical protein
VHEIVIKSLKLARVRFIQVKLAIIVIPTKF